MAGRCRGSDPFMRPGTWSPQVAPAHPLYPLHPARHCTPASATASRPSQGLCSHGRLVPTFRGWLGRRWSLRHGTHVYAASMGSRRTLGDVSTRLWQGWRFVGVARGQRRGPPCVMALHGLWCLLGVAEPLHIDFAALRFQRNDGQSA